MIDVTQIHPGVRLKVIDDFDRAEGPTWARGVRNMLKFAGETVTCRFISSVEYADLQVIKILEDKHDFDWSPYCFEYIVDEEDEDRFGGDVTFDLSELFEEV